MTTTFTKPGIRYLFVEANPSIHPAPVTLLLASGRELLGQLLDYDDRTGLLCFAELIEPSLPKQPRYLPDLHIDVNHVIGVRFLESRVPDPVFVEGGWRP